MSQKVWLVTGKIDSLTTHKKQLLIPWIVLGCSTGLGNELIQRIIQRGDKAIATARNLSTLKSLQHHGAFTVQLDITASEDTLKQKGAEAINAYGHIDVVVHNAGVFQMGAYEDLTYVQWSME
jgi:NAD(P)-dependent dehydrogenase (short-subunit alcohol dehydrogenase family)